MNYIKHLFLSLLLSLLLILSFNWLIDPYGMYWSPLIEGLNNKKVEASTRSRLTKDYVIKVRQPEVVLIGNSRIEMGLNPESSYFRNKSVYNIGLPGLGLLDQFQKAHQQIKENKRLSKLIISIDYLDFLYEPKVHLQLKPPEFSGFKNSNHSFVQKIKNKTPLLASLDTTVSSFYTIFKQHSNASSLTPYGFNTATSFIDTVKVEGKKALFKQKLIELTNRLKDNNYKQTNKHWKTEDRNIVALTSLVESAKQKDIEVVLFINPYHVTYLNLLNDLGYWTDFLNWKARIANLIGTLVPVYDFSGLNKFTTEQINLNKPKTEMKWFWEPAHYKKELGELMLPILINSNIELNLNLDSEIVRELTPHSIESILKEDKKELISSNASWQKLKVQLGI